MRIFLFLSVFFLYNFTEATDATSPVEQSLKFFDADSNGKIDSLFISFDEILTGTLIKTKFRISSAAGGLSASAIGSSTDISAKIINSKIIGDGKTLRIVFSEYDKIGTGLTITNGSNSHLRIKNLTGIGISDSAGNPISISVSSSFDNYSNSKVNYGYVFDRFFCMKEICGEFTIPKDIKSAIGQDIKIPIYGKGFSGKLVSAGSFALKYDKTIMNCSGLNIINNGLNQNLIVNNNAGSGFFGLIFAGTGFSIEDNQKILEFDCKTLSKIGTGTLQVKGIKNGLLSEDILISDPNSIQIKTFYSEGKITIEDNLFISGIINNVAGIAFTGGLQAQTKSGASFSNISFTGTGYKISSFGINENYEVKIFGSGNGLVGDVNIGDVIKIMRNIVGLDSFTGYQTLSADVNNDKELNIFDIVKIRRFILFGASDSHIVDTGKIKSFVNFSGLSCFTVDYQETFLKILNMTSSKTNQNFILLKKGDIDGK